MRDLTFNGFNFHLIMEHTRGNVAVIPTTRPESIPWGVSIAKDRPEILKIYVRDLEKETSTVLWEADWTEEQAEEAKREWLKLYPDGK